MLLSYLDPISLCLGSKRQTACVASPQTSDAKDLIVVVEVVVQNYVELVYEVW